MHQLFKHFKTLLPVHSLLHLRVKVLHAKLRQDPEMVKRALQEVRILGRLKSPHIAKVAHAGRTRTGQPYVVMEHLEGRPLSEYLLERGRLHASECVQILIEVCHALERAHQEGVIHRDLKPNNIFLERLPKDADGRDRYAVQLLDFGFAKIVLISSLCKFVFVFIVREEVIEATTRAALRQTFFVIGGKLVFPGQRSLKSLEFV